MDAGPIGPGEGAAAGHRPLPRARPLYVRVLRRSSESPGVRETGSLNHQRRNPLINLQQDADGFIRMPRHFPASVRISITFNDGAAGEFTGQQLNQAYDNALAEYRAKNNLDAKGFSRAPRTKTNSGNKIEFVPVHPGMGK